MNENEERARAILAQIEYVTLATSSPDGHPWNAPVWAAFDEAYHFFWVSAKYARHSQNIRANNRIAMVVYDSTVPPREGKKGVYIEARAYELTDEQACSHALACLQSRGWEHPPSVDMVVGATLRGVYKAVPEKIWISTEDSNGLDGRVEVDVREM
jgi:nitroimidazol reductase NimA-like FMN-containing flavoprotein (pyridoxamine 5'-phosphate oxidase superfamily)